MARTPKAEEDLYKTISLLEADVETKDIAAMLDIPYSRVIRYKSEYTTAKLNNSLADLLDVDKLMLIMADDFKDKVPALANNVDKTVAKLTGLQRLDEHMQQAASGLITQIVSHTLSIESADDIPALTKSLCDLRLAFFPANKQINVQTNVTTDGGATTKYGSLLNDKPAN